MVTYGQLTQIKEEIKAEVTKLDKKLQELLDVKASQELDEFTKKQINSAIDKGIIKFEVRVKDIEKQVTGLSESI